MRHLALLLVCVGLLHGCYIARRATNESLKPDQIAQLEPGRTTAKEVVELLGAPTEVVQLARRSAYRYDATLTKDTGLWLIVVGFYNSDTRADRLWVFFDEGNVLTHVGSTLSADRAVTQMPWEDRK